MNETKWPPRKDYVATYRKYAEMRLCAQTDLRLLLAKAEAVGPTTPNRTRDALQLDIALAKRYLGRLDAVMADFSKALAMFSLTYGRTEYAMFAKLIIEGNDPKDVALEINLSVAYVRNKRSQFQRDLSNCDVS